jgi:hypothetical protein
MPWPHLMPLIMRRADSSAGALQSNFTLHLSPSEPEPSDPVLRFEWDQIVTGGRLVHAITLRQTEAGSSLSEEDLRRLACHVVIARLPEIAIREASESLAEIWEYYRTLPRVQLPPLLPPAPVQATWGETYESPIFHIDED